MVSWFETKRIFLDYASATPLLPEVKKVMDKYLTDSFHNPSAIYEEGVKVKEEIKESRARVARALGIAPSGVIFTASGTESDNLAIFGTFEKSLEKIRRPHIIVSAIEHPAVLAAADEVKRRGGEVSILPVKEDGTVSIEIFRKILKKNTCLVSIGLANSEIGTIEPIQKIGRIIKEFRKEHESIYPYLHTDASQAVNFLNVTLEGLQVDLLTLDGSKIYGPKGSAILALRKEVEITSIVFGGSQEGGKRAGTPNPAAIVGFAKAFEIALKDREKESNRLETIRKRFVESIIRRLPKVIINGSSENHLPNIVSVSFPGMLSEFMLLKLDKHGVLASVGSACSYDEKISGSPVIRALGKEELAEATLRFSFGRQTTESEIDKTIDILVKSSDMVK